MKHGRCCYCECGRLHDECICELLKRVAAQVEWDRKHPMTPEQIEEWARRLAAEVAHLTD